MLKLGFFWHWGHRHNMCMEMREKSWDETKVIIPFKHPEAIWKESRLRWAKCSEGRFALWPDWQEKTLTLPDVWDLAEGSFSRLSCLSASFCWLLRNKSPSGECTWKSAKNKPSENNNRKQASRDLTPFTKSLLHSSGYRTVSMGINPNNAELDRGVDWVNIWSSQAWLQLDIADPDCSSMSG